MTINLSSPNAAWLKQRINQDVAENTTFTITIGAVTSDGPKDVKVEVDLVWFIVLYITDKTATKLHTVLELLKNPVLLQKFKNTQTSEQVKRIIAEFLIFNYEYLDALKNYIDFKLLNIPLDFISYSLFIKRGADIDTPSINMERLKIVNSVLDSNFKVDAKSIDANQASVVSKVLLMEEVENKFAIAERLVAAGYPLFSSNPINDSACAIRLIDARNLAAAQLLINKNSAHFKNIRLHVAGSNGEVGNLADYYYWVKEDLDAMHYLKDNFGIELTPSA